MPTEIPKAKKKRTQSVRIEVDNIEGIHRLKKATGKSIEETYNRVIRAGLKDIVLTEAGR